MSKFRRLCWPPGDWGAKNRAAGRMFLEHALLVSDATPAFNRQFKNASASLGVTDVIGFWAFSPMFAMKSLTEFLYRSTGAGLARVPTPSSHSFR
jgi:hypothetical protein